MRLRAGIAVQKMDPVDTLRYILRKNDVSGGDIRLQLFEIGRADDDGRHERARSDEGDGERSRVEAGFPCQTHIGADCRLSARLLVTLSAFEQCGSTSGRTSAVEILPGQISLRQRRISEKADILPQTDLGQGRFVRTIQEVVGILNRLDDTEVLAIMGKMEEEQVSKILPLFDSSRAARLTQSMMRPAKLE